MRLLLVNSQGAWRGGAPRSIAAWARGLRRRGHHVALAAPRGPWLDELCAEGMPGYELPRSERLHGLLEQATPLNAARLWRILRRERPDRVHTFQYGSHLLVRAVAEAARVPWVHTLLGPLSPGQRFAGGPYVAVAAEFAGEAALRGAGCVSVVAGRVDLSRFTPLPAPLGPPVVGFASRLEGRLIPIAALVARALSQLDDGVRGVIAGDGPGLDALRAEYPRVAFCGHLADIRPLLAESHVWVGAGRTLMEGLASGRPCVSVGSHGFGGVVDAAHIAHIAAYNFGGRHVPQGGSAEALADTLRGLLSDPATRDTLAQLGPRWAAAHLDVEAGLDGLERVYGQATLSGGTLSLLRSMGADKVARSARRCVARFAD